MFSVKSLISKSAYAALLGAGLLFATTGVASAYVVCNAEGDCWHTDHRYHYDRDYRVQYHDDDWYFHRDWNNDHDHHWREYHEGRGRWHNGVWITF
jgi:hypothetical protein